MKRPLNVMLVGESWFTFSTHQKGFDTFQTAEYTEGAATFIAGVEGMGHRVRYIPAHRVDADFPADPAGFAGTDVVILSDVGANTFLLTKQTFNRSEIVPNRLEALCSYVEAGGALLMIGGYLSFSGIEGKARYGHSPLADVLPVTVLDHDDRVEVPQGFIATVVDASHPALAAVPTSWPRLLGYNRVEPRNGSTLLVSRGDDPILVVGSFGSGRTAAFTPDLAPHWAPPEFVDWASYPQLWDSLLRWLAGGYAVQVDPLGERPGTPSRTGLVIVVGSANGDLVVRVEDLPTAGSHTFGVLHSRVHEAWPTPLNAQPGVK